MSSPDQSQNVPSPSRRGAAEFSLLGIAALAWFGLIVCTLLLHGRPELRAALCPARAGCETVLASQYSTFFGVPLPWIGLTYYASVELAVLGVLASSSSRVRDVLFSPVVWISVSGACFSALLMVVQFAVLRAFCPLCTASALIVIAIAVTAYRSSDGVGAPGEKGLPGTALVIGAIVASAMGFLVYPTIFQRDELLAFVDGRRLMRSEMDMEIGLSVAPHLRALNVAEREWVQRKVDGMLLEAEASRRGIAVSALIEECERSAAPVTGDDVANEIVRRGIPSTAETIEAVGRELRAARVEAAKVELLGQIGSRHGVQVFLRPRRLQALAVDLAHAQVLGPRDAKVQLVVYSDFQCGFCRQLDGVLKQVHAKFPREVLIAYRHYPIERHVRALPAAIAAECAAEQGLFWKYHDLLYAEGNDLSDARLDELAASAGLDMEKFSMCRRAGQAKTRVDASFDEALANGIEGAPALFLNGRQIGGLIEYERLVRMIERELR